jgi:hypothetical protein
VNIMEPKLERRSYYRINDIVGLTYNLLGEDNQNTASPSENLGLSLTSLLSEIDHEFNQITNTLWHEHPMMAKALGLLNRKLSIIAAHSLQNEEQSIEPYDEMMVNISGCGISFDCTEQLQTGDQLGLSLVLKPSNVMIDLEGEVISCEKQLTNTDKPYAIRVSFKENNSAQEQLIQHIVQKQCAQIGENKRQQA